MENIQRAVDVNRLLAGVSDKSLSKKNAVAKDGYPWLNLVELNDAGQIWNRYLAGNGGGKILFVDPDGKILLIDKEISEIASMLEHLMTDN